LFDNTSFLTRPDLARLIAVDGHANNPTEFTQALLISLIDKQLDPCNGIRTGINTTDFGFYIRPEKRRK
jgi:hypothetical protein